MLTQNDLLDPLKHILEIPSISTQSEYQKNMLDARHYLLDLFNSLGFKTKILKAKKHDAIFASLLSSPKLPTVLIYGHYDVQPPDPLDEWITPPFEPTIRNGIIYGRGTTDNKCQFMIHLMAIKKLTAAGKKLNVNIKFIIEGEEEIGSPSITDLANKYSKSLLSCDYLIVSDSQMYAAGKPSIDISLRGLLYTEIILTTGRHDLHSGQFGGVAENPINILAGLISKLKNDKGKILIPGFYRNVKPFAKQELLYFRELKTTPKIIYEEGDLNLIGGGENNYTINERRWTRPTLDVNGIWGGYQGEGSKTIIPSIAGAKISMRLVLNQDPDKIFVLFDKFIRKITPSGVNVEIKRNADCFPYRSPTDNQIFSLIKKSIKKYFGKNPVYTGVGGSIGFVPIMANKLKVPCVMVGFGLPDDNLHAPNEKFSLKNYFTGIDAMADFYSNIDKMNSKGLQ